MSSQQQQHVINMTGLDSGPVTTVIGGGATGQSGTAGIASSSISSGSTVNIPPGTYRPGSSQRSPHVYQSVYSPMSASQALHVNSPTTSSYTSPRLATLSPTTATASTSQLSRSQSLGHAAYQQLQAASSQQQGYGTSSLYPQTSLDASPYRTREKNHPSYSEGASGGALLPTINTHVSRNSHLGSPYSPNMKHSMSVDPPSFASGPPKSPVTRQQGGGSPYTPNIGHSNRPVSMYDASYGHLQNPSSRNSYHTMDNARTSPGAPLTHPMGSGQHLRASDGSSSGTLPAKVGNSASPHMGDSLPLYSSPSAPMNHLQSSPYMHTSSSQLVGAPPRTNAGGAYGVKEFDRVSGEAGDPNASSSNRERRGTVTNADAAGAREFAKWDRQQRLAAAEAQQNQPPAPRLQEGFKRVRDLSDLKAVNEPALAGIGRRADPSGGYVSVSALDTR